MKKTTSLLLCIAILCANPLFSGDDINQYKDDTESLWRRGAGAEEGAFSAISISMLGWGVGLAVGIAILASVLHQSTASTSHSHSGECD